MLIAVAILCVTLAVANAVGAIIATALFMLVGLLAAHVIGNAVGTRLRDQDRSGVIDEPPAIPSVPQEYEPARKLQENTTVNRRWIIAATFGAILGGTIGGIVISIDLGAKQTVAGLCLAVGSSAVLGGFAAFMATSLWSVARSALGEAIDTHYDPINEIPNSSDNPPHGEG